MDESIRIIWYDLEEADADEYVEWLHKVHMPEVSARPGVAWTAHYKVERTHAMMKRLIDFVGRPEGYDDIPQGWQYAFMVGAASPHVFFMPGMDDVDAQNEATTAMAAKRRGTRTAITTEQARVDGPAVASRPPGTTPAPFIQLGHFRVGTLQEEMDLSSWYANYRLPAITRMAGAVAARKMVTVAGWAKHVILYEFTSRRAHEESFMGHESLAFDQGEWTNRVVTYTQHSPGSPSIAARIWPPE